MIYWGNLRERGQFEDPGVDRNIILKYSFRSGMWVMDWIELVQDRNGWRTLVNAVINLRVP
jgi:hypothetical protein